MAQPVFSTDEATLPERQRNVPSCRLTFFLLAALIAVASASAQTTSISTGGGPVDYYILAGPQPKHVLESYAWLTALPPLQPLWSLGFQQSRYSYTPASSSGRLPTGSAPTAFPLTLSGSTSTSSRITAPHHQSCHLPQHARTAQRSSRRAVPHHSHHRPPHRPSPAHRLQALLHRQSSPLRQERRLSSNSQMAATTSARSGPAHPSSPTLPTHRSATGSAACTSRSCRLASPASGTI